jgi:2-polyprenyl-3-methyl-5-hydroxy-6-metoxy-1,4-benzoquinol methylase
MENHPFYRYGVQSRTLSILSGLQATRILDVGCATGYLGRKLMALDNNRAMYGIEYDPIAAEEASKYYKHVYVGEVEQCAKHIQDGFFDAIVCADVLEHMSRPDRTLFILRNLLRENGFLVVSIPNIGYIKPRLRIAFGNFNYEDTGFFDKTHLRFFTLRTAKQLLEESGFKVIKSYQTRIGALIPILPSWLSSHALLVSVKK